MKISINGFLGYDFEVKYELGKFNGAVDALSRRMYFVAISSVQFFDWDEIEDELLVDDKLKKVLQDLVDTPDSHPGFELR